jgi:hypothetical protein
VKRLQTNKEMLARVMMLKDADKYKRMFISPDIKRRQQDMNREMRRQLKAIRYGGTRRYALRMARW